MKELMMIQQELHAPKGQRNNFGKYNYRSCEDILLAVKPLLEKYECILLLSDTINELATPYALHSSKTDRDGQEQMDYNGTRVYVEATATIINKNGAHISVTASAREDIAKKGMDAAQITGATSSYARKYALNGLFCIDDNKDVDTNEHHEEKKNRAKADVAAKEEAKVASDDVAKTVTTPAPAPTPVATNIIAAPKGWGLEDVKKRISDSNTLSELMSIHMTYGDNSEVSAALSERKRQIKGQG